MRLLDCLAARHSLYSRPIPTMPDVLLIDVPDHYAGPGLLLGRYYPIIVKSAVEQEELFAFLSAERDRPVAPDLLDRRASHLEGQNILFGRYDPPEEGWPWLLLCYWPADYVRLCGDDASQFARGRYTSELFETGALLNEAIALLHASLSANHMVEVRHLTPVTVSDRA